MRIVSWNCNGALRKKHEAIDRLNPDLIVVQECEDPERSTKAYRSWAGHYLWHGDSKNKGIGIVARSELTLRRLDWDDDVLQLFLPCHVDERFALLGVWTKHAHSPNFRYIGQLWKYLQLHKEKMATDEFLLCGDLNSNKCWDEWDRSWNHTDVVRELEEIGIRSIYHDEFDEPQGSETRPTLFHQRNRSKPYHVDYMFASTGLYTECSMSVGDVEDWLELSDHMPLTLEFR
ncbi:MAG: endonuclease/exonuclease/phosphatase family protein [Planctomycetota bacterium]